MTRASLRVAIGVLAAAIVGLVVTAVVRGRVGLGASPADEFAVWGVDVSRHQGEIDWPRVARHERIRFAYVKASEGGDWTDPRFAANWAGARAAGLKVGAYHYFTFCRPGADQAKNFLATIPLDAGALPPVLDVEFAGNCRTEPDPAAVRREVTVWLEQVRARTGQAPLLYLTRESYEAFFAGAGFDNRLWLRSVFVKPSWPEGVRWEIWQFADDARVPGVDGPVDLNALAGELAALAAP